MNDLQQLYQQVILDHSRLRNGLGSVAGASHTSHQVNPTCGDEVTLAVEVDEAGNPTSVVWEGDGCSISQASLSMMCDLVAGADKTTVAKLYRDMEQMMHSRGQGVPEAVLDDLGDAAALEGTSQFPNRVKCALLGWYALRDALAKAVVDILQDNEADASTAHPNSNREN